LFFLKRKEILMDNPGSIIGRRYGSSFYEGWTMLHSACNYNLLECIKTILDDGDDVNARTAVGFTPLYIACQDPRTLECAKLLIAAGADTNIISNNGWGPLHTACAHGVSADYIKLLLSAGANINAQSEEGCTPLHIACQFRRIQIVQTLLEAGADPSIRNDEDKLPQDIPDNEEIEELINNFGLGGGRATKAAADYE
jgi:ankyrin repeat protein